MRRPKVVGPASNAALDAYRAFAQAEADAHFDERVLDAQRRRILVRLAHLGRAARVIPFPAALHAALPASGVNRRWVSVAAAAGLIIGLVGGQFVHILAPPRAPRAARVEAPVVSAPPRPVVAAAEDDGLLGEVDSMVQLRTAAELRVLDELTPLHDSR